MRKAVCDLWPYALVLFLYLATSPYHQGLNNPNEMVRVYMTKAIAEEGTFAIDRVVGEWGGVDDKAMRNGRLYSSKAPLQSLLGVPAFKAAGPLLRALSIAPTKRMLTTFLRICTSAIPGFIFASLLVGWARRRATELDAPRATGTAVGLALALGTMLYPYALTFTGHLAAAFSAGGAYLAVAAMSQSAIFSRRWRLLAILAGLGAGASPFAEYPAALVSAPALVGAIVMAPTWRARAEVAMLFALGGAAPFVLGLWAHERAWGSPFKTGYAFLENRAYVEVHGKGFFGVSAPKAAAFAGSLFSPGTGLFFFSPILLIGLAALVTRALQRSTGGFEDGRTLGRGVAIIGLIGFVLEVLFISGHQGWRGGWTLGPRYIIAVAPLLGIWVIEALANARVRAFIASFGAISIVLTGSAAALYPHLSDVYTNPLRTFLLPSYLRGEITYGLGHWIGLGGTLSNLVHLVPLGCAALYVASAGAARTQRIRRTIIVTITFAAMLGIIFVIPERDRNAAENENERLWSFWEPRVTGPSPTPPRSGLLYEARTGWRDARVEAVTADGQRHTCTPEGLDRCRYGTEPWHHFGPDTLEMNGTRLPIVFMHPIGGSTVRATFPARPAARHATFRYGLADASVASDNQSPVKIRLAHGATSILETDAGNVRGLRSIDLALSSTTAPITLELECEKDGARVFGFDLELYR